MKKGIAILLLCGLLLSLCACGGSGGQTSTEPTGPADSLQVGYAKVSITPSYLVGMEGYSDSEFRSNTDGIQDRVYITCIAVTSGEETILLYTVDTCHMSAAYSDMLRQMVTLETGIKEDRIFVGATHGHNCPALSKTYDTAEKYIGEFYKNGVTAAVDALRDRAPATLSRAKADHEGMNFVRHYTLADGTNVANSGATGRESEIVGHPMPTDPQMILLKFERQEPKKDILMVNWQAHPDSASSIGYNILSPGFIGPLRNKLETDTGMLVAYFTGASGNQNYDSKMASESHGLDWFTYGEKLAELACGMIEKLEPVEGDTIKTTKVLYDANVDHSWDHMLKEANEVYDIWKREGLAAGNEAGKKYGFTSSYQARAIRSRSNMGLFIQMDIRAFSIGGVGFTTGTYEMFSDNALYVKENSPFETTFIITGNLSYMPSDIAYTYRGYEVDTGYYARGTAEGIAEKYVEMLNEVK